MKPGVAVLTRLRGLCDCVSSRFRFFGVYVRLLALLPYLGVKLNICNIDFQAKRPATSAGIAHGKPFTLGWWAFCLKRALCLGPSFRGASLGYRFAMSLGDRRDISSC